MVKIKPFLLRHRFPNFKLKFKLGALLLCLSFFLNYQPSFSFPPVERPLVYAETTQEQSVTPSVSPVTFQLPFTGYITTTFSSYHPGIDLCAGLGMPIKPIAKGTVVETGFNFFGLGLMVEVEHEGGYRSLYGHMGKIYVTKGQTVGENDYLGEIGMTGHTSGPHTHLEVSKDGVKINPLTILPEIRKFPKEEDFVARQSSTPSAVLVPVATPNASVSAQNSTIVETPKEELKAVLNDTKEQAPKNILNEQTMQNLLNLGTPKPSATPLPQGGKISLLNFNLFGFKK